MSLVLGLEHFCPWPREVLFSEKGCPWPRIFLCPWPWPRALCPRLHLCCQLHANELPLRHLMQKLDGKTNGPAGFTGKIGKTLKDCEKRPVNVHFNPIPTERINVGCDDLSTDQKYLLEIHTATSQGRVDDPVFERDPGVLNHSRWLTTANRILQFYVSQADTFTSLIFIAEFIMKVYAPMWFRIKCNSSVVNGAKHSHETIQKTPRIPSETKK